MKKCSKCNIEKEYGDFHKDGSRKDGYMIYCKICRKEFYQENIEKIKEYRKEYKKEYRQNNKEKIKNYNKEYRDNNKERIKEYYQNNKEKIKENNKEYNRERRKTDPLFRLSDNLRSSIRKSLRRNNHTKKSTTQSILGCSFEEFKIYLESKFEEWMSYDNYGKYNGELNYGWDIDHIIPISSATTEEDIIKLNHYTNLQPLCSKVNRDIKRDNLN